MNALNELEKRLSILESEVRGLKEVCNIEMFIDELANRLEYVALKPEIKLSFEATRDTHE